MVTKEPKWPPKEVIKGPKKSQSRPSKEPYGLKKRAILWPQNKYK